MEIGAVKSVISELWVPNAFQVEQINVAREHNYKRVVRSNSRHVKHEFDTNHTVVVAHSIPRGQGFPSQLRC